MIVLFCKDGSEINYDLPDFLRYDYTLSLIDRLTEDSKDCLLKELLFFINRISKATESMPKWLAGLVLNMCGLKDVVSSELDKEEVDD